MNTKKIVSSFIFAAVFSAALVSDASASDPRNWRLRRPTRREVGMGGLAATGVGLAWRLWKGGGIGAGQGAPEPEADGEATRQQEATPEFVSFEGSISTHATEDAPVIVHHSRQGNLEVCAMIGCSHEVYPESRANTLFNRFLVRLREPGIDAGEVSRNFIMEYVNSVPPEIWVQILVIDSATETFYLGAVHYCGLIVFPGLPNYYTTTEAQSVAHFVDVDGTKRYYKSSVFSLADVEVDRFVFTDRNTYELIKSHAGVNKRSVWDNAVPNDDGLSPAQNVINFLSTLPGAQGCPGFAAIVVDFSPVGDDADADEEDSRANANENGMPPAQRDTNLGSPLGGAQGSSGCNVDFSRDKHNEIDVVGSGGASVQDSNFQQGDAFGNIDDDVSWLAIDTSAGNDDEGKFVAYTVSTASTDGCPFVVVHEVIGEYRVCAMFSSDDAGMNTHAAEIFRTHVNSWVSTERVDFRLNSKKFANDFLTLLDDNLKFRGMPIQWLLIENENLEREAQVISGGNNPWSELRSDEGYIVFLKQHAWKHHSKQAVQVVSADTLAGQTFILCGPHRFPKGQISASAMQDPIFDQAQAQGAEGVLSFVAGQRGMNEKPLAAIVINFGVADGELAA